MEYKTFMELIDYIKNRFGVSQLSPNAKTEFELYLEEERKLYPPKPSSEPMSSELYLDQDRVRY